jgi:hypothetical protein
MHVVSYLASEESAFTAGQMVPRVPIRMHLMPKWLLSTDLCQRRSNVQVFDWWCSLECGDWLFCRQGDVPWCTELYYAKFTFSLRSKWTELRHLNVAECCPPSIFPYSHLVGGIRESIHLLVCLADIKDDPIRQNTGHGDGETDRYFKKSLLSQRSRFEFAKRRLRSRTHTSSRPDK